MYAVSKILYEYSIFSLSLSFLATAIITKGKNYAVSNSSLTPLLI